MKKTILTLAVAIAVVATAATAATVSGEKDVMAVVSQFGKAFNTGDAKTVVSLCADEAAIIDEFPPYVWHGAGACQSWLNDYDADAKKNGVTDGIVTLGKPKHVDVMGDHAYVVVPTDYTYKVKGKPVKETASMWTLVLQKGAAGWRVAAWSWAKN